MPNETQNSKTAWASSILLVMASVLYFISILPELRAGKTLAHVFFGAGIALLGVAEKNKGRRWVLIISGLGIITVVALEFWLR